VGTEMTYGSYHFSPVPLVTINKIYQKSDGGVKLGTLYRMTLDGVLTPLPDDDTGIINVMPLQDDLRTAFAQEGCPFGIACDGNVLWTGHPRINNITLNRTNNNWVETTAFTIELEFDDEPTGAGEDDSLDYIESANEQWNLEFLDDRSYFTLELPGNVTDPGPYVLRVSHQLSAKGKTHYNSCDNVPLPAWKVAENFVQNRLGFDNNHLEATGVVNFDISNFGKYNHMRTRQADELAGTFSVTENWLVISTGVNTPSENALEDFTMDVRKGITDPFTQITINGTIQGLETRTYEPTLNITESKYAAASGYWNVVQNRLYNRVQLAASGVAVRTINTTPVSEVITHSPSRGTIAYSYSYDDRPSNCIAGALSESIEIVDNNPTDVMARLTVLGRAVGPILQDINTITESSRDIAIEVVTNPATGYDSATDLLNTGGVATQVESLLCEFQTNLTNTYNQVFKTTDNERWNPKTGRYSRNVRFVYQDCDIINDTSLC